MDKDSITSGVCDDTSQADKIFLNVTPDVSMDRVRRLPGCDCDVVEFTGINTMGTCYCESGYDVDDKTCTDSGGKDYKAEIVCSKEVELPPTYVCSLSVAEEDRPSITNSECTRGSLLLEVEPAVDMTYTSNFPGCDCGISTTPTGTTGSCTCQSGFTDIGVSCQGNPYYAATITCEQDEATSAVPEFRIDMLLIALAALAIGAILLLALKKKK